MNGGEERESVTDSYSMRLQLHAAVTELEQEKFELQKKHTGGIQELLEDTNHRLAKMEAEYNARSQATVSTASVDLFSVAFQVQCLV